MVQNNNSFISSLKNIGKQLLYTESENTNTDREKIVEVNSQNQQRITNKAGAGPQTHNSVNNQFK